MFKRFVEAGRLALITYGPCTGRMCVIVDIVDQKRVVVDGPASITGVKRHMMPIRRLSLTDFKVRIGRGCREKCLKKCLASEKTFEEWNKTKWAKKIALRTIKREMTDFDRFFLRKAK